MKEKSGNNMCAPVILLGLGLVFFSAAVVPAVSQGAEDVQGKRHYDTAAESLKAIIRSGHLEGFSASFTQAEWYTPSGKDRLAPIDVAILENKSRYVPEKIINSIKMRRYRWERNFNGEPLFFHALAKGSVGDIIFDEDYKNPARIWDHEINGKKVVYHIIKKRMMDKVPSQLYLATHQRYWKNTTVNGSPVVDFILMEKGEFEKFFNPPNWKFKSEAMREVYQWMRERHSVIKSGADLSGAELAILFRKLQKEVDLLEKRGGKREPSEDEKRFDSPDTAFLGVRVKYG